MSYRTLRSDKLSNAYSRRAPRGRPIGPAKRGNGILKVTIENNVKVPRKRRWNYQFKKYLEAIKNEEKKIKTIPPKKFPLKMDSHTAPGRLRMRVETQEPKVELVEEELDEEEDSEQGTMDVDEDVPSDEPGTVCESTESTSCEPTEGRKVRRDSEGVKETVDDVFTQNVHTTNGCSLNAKFTNIMFQKERITNLRKKGARQRRQKWKMNE